MTKEKNRLAVLSARMKTESPISEKRNSEIGETDGPAVHGSKGDFRKVTVTLPPAVYESLLRESTRRKIAGEPDHLMASIIRGAVINHLKNL